MGKKMIKPTPRGKKRKISVNSSRLDIVDKRYIIFWWEHNKLDTHSFSREVRWNCNMHWEHQTSFGEMNRSTHVFQSQSKWSSSEWIRDEETWCQTVFKDLLRVRRLVVSQTATCELLIQVTRKWVLSTTKNVCISVGFIGLLWKLSMSKYVKMRCQEVEYLYKNTNSK